MSDTLLSSFLMIDRPLAPASGRSAAGAKEQKCSARSENARELFVGAFLHTLQGSEQVMSRAIAPDRLTELAGAAADVALGNSVILQLKPDLNESRRSCVRAFLEKWSA